ncbi:HAD superfamily hydrolase (TIGR01484 family) [Marmoricola sp. OAE513]|uniref:HAD family hydrolase n=1 Tax=Marmoricola sp. OAE513 TaxID=2817894 RepID=UPI001AE81B5B
MSSAPRPGPVRLVATDLDGTLLRSDGTVSPRTAEALIAVEEAGVDVVFVTGRPLRWAEEVFSYVGRHGFAIVSNGALVWDVARSAVQRTRAIEPAVALEVAERLRAAVPDSHFAVETLAGIALEHGFMERYPLPPGSVRGTAAEILTGPAFKLLARHESLDPQEYWDRAVEAVGDLVEVTWSSTTTLLEISAYDVTKASTLELFCAERGITAAEVVALGDMPNDLPMLSWAGTSYAMANAHPSVRAVATHLAASNDEDGVAQVMEGLLDTSPAPG